MTSGNRAKVLLATFGTLGDIYPFIAMAKAIDARGLAAVIAAPEMHRDAIEREAVAYAPIRPQMSDVCAALGTDIAGAYKIMRANPHFLLDEIYMRFLRATYADVLTAAAGAQAILAHSLLVGAHLAAAGSRLPTARVALAPLHLQSAASPSMTPSAPYILTPCVAPAVGYNRIVRLAVRGSVAMRMRRLRALRREIGMARSGEDLFLDFGRRNSADRIFGLYSPLFAPAQADQPRNLDVVGFPFFEAVDRERRTLEPRLRAFLEAGAPPIVFTLGSFVPELAGDFYDIGLRVARALGRRAVLLAGARERPRLAAAAGPDEIVCAHAPHALLFPASACVVHHGGAGTTAEALRAGKPQVVVPFFGDQPDHAARIVRLGLGQSVNLARFDVARATAALGTLLAGDAARRATDFAAAMAHEPGVAAVADWAAGVVSARAAA